MDSPPSSAEESFLSDNLEDSNEDTDTALEEDPYERDSPVTSEFWLESEKLSPYSSEDGSGSESGSESESVQLSRGAVFPPSLGGAGPSQESPSRGDLAMAGPSQQESSQEEHSTADSAQNGSFQQDLLTAGPSQPGPSTAALSQPCHAEPGPSRLNNEEQSDGKICFVNYSWFNDFYSYKIHKCQRCGMLLQDENSLRLHNNVHENEKYYTCNTCNARYTDAREFMEHYSTHRRSEHKCRVCRKTFHNLEDLKTHEKVHSDSVVFFCELCGKTFPNYMLYVKHLRCHFRKSKELRATYLKAQNRGLRFLCQLCDRIFYTERGLYVHTTLDHTNEPAPNIDHTRNEHTENTVPCEICGLAFLTFGYKEIHKTLVHGGEN